MSDEINQQSSDTELTAAPSAPRDVATMPGFTSNANWELAQRIGKAFASSTLVPAAYQGHLANCIVALEMANRMGASPLLVMQNLYIVHGNPGWSSKFLIATFNQCGRYSALRYQWNDARTSCRAYAIEKATGETLYGPEVTLEMAKLEGWSTKQGSKWKTMPELMLMYRAAAFLIRTYAPEISMGLNTVEEAVDMGIVEEVQSVKRGPSVAMMLASTPTDPDPETGEVSPPPPQARTGSVLRGAAPKAKTVEEYLAMIEGAKNDDVAALILDEARDMLTEPAQRELLSTAFKTKWGTK